MAQLPRITQKHAAQWLPQRIPKHRGQGSQGQTSPFHEHDRGKDRTVLRRPARRSSEIFCSRPPLPQGKRWVLQFQIQRRVSATQSFPRYHHKS